MRLKAKAAPATAHASEDTDDTKADPARQKSGDDTLRHKWREEKVPDRPVLRYTSQYAAPQPYSQTGDEPEAVMLLEAAQPGRQLALADLLESEIAGIRKTLKVAPYTWQGPHEAERGIASYTETINGVEVGFIQYMVAGDAVASLAYSRSVRHAHVLHGGKHYCVHLIVVYPGHLQEQLEDQMRLIRAVTLYPAAR